MTTDTRTNSETPGVSASEDVLARLQQRMASLEEMVSRHPPRADGASVRADPREKFHLDEPENVPDPDASGNGTDAAGSPLVIGQSNQGGRTITFLDASPTPNSATFAANNSATDRPIGLHAVAGERSGVLVSGGAVVGTSKSQIGVCGYSTDSYGVEARSINGIAHKAASQTNYGVVAQSNGSDAVYGISSGRSGVLGYSSAATGAGVEGYAASTGLGARFQGGRAPIQLVPGGSSGAPATGSHAVGELYVDATGALYLCKAAGTPGTWKLIG